MFTSDRPIPGCRRASRPSWGHCGWRKITGATSPFSSWTIPAGRSRLPSQAMSGRRTSRLCSWRETRCTTAPRRLTSSGCCATWPGMPLLHGPARLPAGVRHRRNRVRAGARAGSGKDLKWFFEDWVNHDRGLPDLSIAGVYPNKSSVPGSYIVAVDVANNGTAEAEVPVSVSSHNHGYGKAANPGKIEDKPSLSAGGPAGEVAVNDGTVPEVEASVHRQTLAVPATSE